MKEETGSQKIHTFKTQAVSAPADLSHTRRKHISSSHSNFFAPLDPSVRGPSCVPCALGEMLLLSPIRRWGNYDSLGEKEGLRFLRVRWALSLSWDLTTTLLAIRYWLGPVKCRNNDVRCLAGPNLCCERPPNDNSATHVGLLVRSQSNLQMSQLADEASIDHGLTAICPSCFARSTLDLTQQSGRDPSYHHLVPSAMKHWQIMRLALSLTNAPIRRRVESVGIQRAVGSLRTEGRLMENLHCLCSFPVPWS